MENSTHSRFDRHEVFAGDDTRTVLDAVIEAGDKQERELENKLSGLFDGYLYHGLLGEAAEKLLPSTNEKLRHIVVRIHYYQQQAEWEKQDLLDVAVEGRKGRKAEYCMECGRTATEDCQFH